MLVRAALLMPFALLAGCERQKDAPPVEIRGGNSADANGGSLKIDTPKLKADVNMPWLTKLMGEMEIDGVKLYPGSTVSGVNVDAKGGSNDRVSMRFAAPADRAKVATWFGEQLAASKFQARPTPTGFAGTTPDGNWFTLDLTSAGATTAGEFKIGETQR